jgi:hypothetical protein
VAWEEAMNKSWIRSWALWLIPVWIIAGTVESGASGWAPQGIYIGGTVSVGGVYYYPGYYPSATPSWTPTFIPKMLTFTSMENSSGWPTILTGIRATWRSGRVNIASGSAIKGTIRRNFN